MINVTRYKTFLLIKNSEWKYLTAGSKNVFVRLRSPRFRLGFHCLAEITLHYK